MAFRRMLISFRRLMSSFHDARARLFWISTRFDRNDLLLRASSLRHFDAAALMTLLRTDDDNASKATSCRYYAAHFAKYAHISRAVDG